MNDNLLRIQNLNVFYHNFQAIYDLSMNIPKGKITSIIGANGAGKSTLLKAICGLIRPVSGKILMRSKDITGLPPKKIG